MKVLQVILLASHVAFVLCIPQDVRFVRPNRLHLRQVSVKSGPFVPIESVPLGFVNHDVQVRSVPQGFQTFVISDRPQNQFVNSAPQLVRVGYSERLEEAPRPSVQYVQRESVPELVHVVSDESLNQRVGQHVAASKHQAEPIFETALRVKPAASVELDNEVVDHRQQQGFVIIPSRQTLQQNFEPYEKKQEQQLPSTQTTAFHSPDDQTGSNQQRNEGYSYQVLQPETQRQPPANYRSDVRPLSQSQPFDSLTQSQTSPQGFYTSQSYPVTVERRTQQGIKSPKAPLSEGALVARLTAPSNDRGSSNILMIRKRPCEICCLENEVQPCKSCCAHTPLLNEKTLKTAVG